MSTPHASTPAGPSTGRPARSSRFRRLTSHLSSRRIAGGVVAGALLTGALLTGTAVLAGPSVAGATPSRPTPTVPAATISTVIGRCDNAITVRYGQIDSLNNAMAASSALTAAHHSELSSDLANARSGLANLKTQIDASTTLAQLRTLCPQIVTGYRVFVLQTPRVNLTMAADRELTSATTLAGISPKLASAITTAQGKGQDVGNAPALLNQLNAQVSAAQGLAGGEAAAVLPLTPASYNAGTAKPVLVSTRGSLAQAHDDLVQARGDAQQIVTILKGLEGSSASTTSVTS